VNPRALLVLALLTIGGLAPEHARAAALLDDVHTIATSSTAVPIEHDVQISAAGTYSIQLTDLGAALTPPAPLTSVELAVTFNDALVGAPLNGAGTLQVHAAAAGVYRLHVVGMPGSTPGSGPIGIQVTSAGNQVVFSSSDTLALPAQATPVGVLDGNLTVQTSGSYTVSLTDLQVPQALGGTLTLLLIAQGATSPTLILPTSNVYQGTAALQAGVTYRVFAIGQSTATPPAGLYSVTVVPTGGGAPVYVAAEPVGATTALGSLSLNAGSATLVLADLAFPAPLSQVEAVLEADGQLAATASSPGSQAFTALAGTYQAFGVATAASTPGAGSYAVEVQQGGASALAVAQGVTASGSSLSAYTFTADVATAGAYEVMLHDFQVPGALATGELAAVQGTSLLGTPVTQAGQFNINAAAGALNLVLFAQGGSGGSLVDVNVATSGGTLIFDQPQGVGAAFTAEKVSVTTAGSYTVTAADLAFPAAFTEFAVVATHGSTLLGQIFGAGSLPPLQATAGVYYVNFIATPASPQEAGTYVLNVSSSPAPPTVTFSADATSVPSGGTVHLVWSSQGATSCLASGGWSGSQATSGTATSPAITATTTFTITCEGAGGSTAQSVTVTLVPSKGGGGALGWELPALALGVLLRAAARRAAPAR
jgi:hypothetical protein